jgi:hypothetical protein
LRSAAVRFQLVRNSPAVGLDFPAYKVETHQREGVSIDILEPCEYSPPNRRVSFGLRLDTSQSRCAKKPYATPAPFFKFGDHILRNENNPGGPADEFVFPGFGRRRHQRKHRGPVWGRDCQPPFAGLNLGIEGYIKSKLVYIESQASILISNENVDGVNAKKRLHN